MLNIQKHKDEILKYAGYQHSLVCLIYEDIMKKNDCTGCCSKCKRETIEWLTSEYKESILTEEEKRIIKDIVKAFEPFNKKPVYISKIGCFSTVGECFLEIKYEDDRTSTPNFKNDELFKGMELRKEYTLEELDLC